MQAIVYVGHGSRSTERNHQFTTFIKETMLTINIPIQTIGFLELESPSITSAIKECVNQGAMDLKIMPVFLSSGVHVTHDIPLEIKHAQKRHPHVEFNYGGPIGVDPIVGTILKQRLMEREFSYQKEECVLLVGHGSREEKPSDELHEIANLLKDEEDVYVQSCFLKTSYPLYEDVLDSEWISPYKKIYIVPHFLFAGVFTDKMTEIAMRVKEKYKDKEFILCDPTGFDDQLKKLIKKRIYEVK